MSRSSQRLIGLVASPSASTSRAVARRGITTSSTSQASAEPSSSNTVRNVRPAPPAKEGVKPNAPFTYKPTKAPKKLPSPFEPSLVHARTHGHHVCTLHLSCYGVSNNVENLDFYTDFALRAAYALGMPCSRPASLPVRTSLYTVPRSPFVHKESQENFTRSTHARVLKVFDSSPETVERWLHWCRIHAMGGLTMRADIYRHYPLTLGAQMASSAQAQLAPPKVKHSNAIAQPKTAQASQTTVQESADTVRAIAEGLKVDLERADAEGAAALEGERKSVEAAAEKKEAKSTEKETKPAGDESKSEKVPAAQEAASTAQPSAAVESESSQGVSTGPAVDATPAPAAQATSTSASAEVKKSDVAAPAPATPSADATKSEAAAPADSKSAPAPAAAEDANVNAKSAEATPASSESQSEAAPVAEAAKPSEPEASAGEKEQAKEDASTTKKEDKA